MYAARATDASLAAADVAATSAASGSGAAETATASAAVGGPAAGAALWTPTKVKTKALTKQVKHIMNVSPFP